MVKLIQIEYVFITELKGRYLPQTEDFKNKLKLSFIEAKDFGEKRNREFH